jgi:glycerol-3-phosphate dehydrogenase
MADEPAHILILGAGINGAAVARELALNGLRITLIDTADLAFGATAYSSRLIHGGLRYLEYGEFDLVRESLAERGRLLRLAPHLVRPLRLFVPVERRWGGLRMSASRFLLGRLAPRSWLRATPRGMWLVRTGLWLYDRYARDPSLPRHSVHRVGAGGVPVDPVKYRWLCAYSDAQVVYPERLVVALLDDARQIARASGAGFEFLNYHAARLNGRTVEIRRSAAQMGLAADADGPTVMTFEPTAIVNATGAWIDRTLARLRIASRPLIGGTKGSHIVTTNPRLREALADGGLYAEAADGRPVFVLPFGEATLVGTTDERYQGDPAQAVATQKELDYLLATVNELLPQVGLSPADIDLHYSGVRPLPFLANATPASITRRHVIEESQAAPVPLFSLIGGKLTTSRSLAEETTGALLARLGLQKRADSRDRFVPGGESYPLGDAALAAACRELAERSGCALAHVRAVWRLCGSRAEPILLSLDAGDRSCVVGTDLPRGYVRWVIRHEWAQTVDDLVERRLMLLYDPRLCGATVRELAELLVEEGVLARSKVDRQIELCVNRLQAHFGKRMGGTP